MIHIQKGKQVLLLFYTMYIRSCPFLNDEFRLMQPAGMDSYFLSCRHTLYVLVGHWL